MLSIFKPIQPFGYGGMLFLLIILSACSRNRDIPRPTRVTQIQFKENLLTVAAGNSAELKVVHSPSELNPPDYDWSVSDASIASVENGMVYGLEAGETEVSVLARGLGLTARIKIRVDPVSAEPVSVESVSLNPQQLVVPVGKGSRLVPRILPELATDQRVLWSSDDPLIATVIDGAVLAMKEGTTTIRVSTVDGGKKASCQVTVIPAQVERIVLSVTNLSLVAGQAYTVEAIVLPEHAKDKSLKWNSSNMSVATVDQQGKVLGLGKGTAIITAVSSSNPRIQSAYQVNVVNPEDMVFIQVTASSKVSVNGYVSANLSGLIENGYSSPIQLISFEVMSHTGEVVIGDYQFTVISPSIQHRHTSVVKNVFRPYIRYVFELNGRRYERRVEI